MRAFHRMLTPLTGMVLMTLATACADSEVAAPTRVETAAATSVQAVPAPAQTAAAGSAVQTAPAVSVRDAAGQPVAGTQVRFRVVAGDGQLGNATSVTGTDGVASVGSWTLGNVAGLNEMSATVDGLPAVRFTATAVAGSAASVRIVSGGEQQAVAGGTFPAPIVAFVGDRFGNGVAGVQVTFATASGGSIEGAQAVTNETGNATSGAWRAGSLAGTQVATVTVSGLAPASVAATALTSAITPPPATNSGSYDVTVRWISAPSPRHLQSVEAAVARWQSVIRNDLSNIPTKVAAGTCFTTQPALNEVVDDLLVFVEIVPIDGAGKILGQAGPCFIRTDNGLPIVGHLKLDVDDLRMMETRGTLDDVVLHELGHVLGIGTLWSNMSLVQGGGGADPVFTGTNAVRGFASIGGIGSTVPVENTGSAGTRDAHWRETTFGNELMTGFISAANNPLSSLTIGSLLDMGYGADPGAASSFTMTATSSTVHAGEEIGHREKIIRPRWKIDKLGRKSGI